MKPFEYRTLTFIAVTLFFFALIQTKESHGDALFLKSVDFFGNHKTKESIFKLETSSLSLTTVVTLQNTHDKLGISPSGQYLALMERKGYVYGISEKCTRSLELLSRAGKALKTIEMEISDYSWHPQKDLLAYIKANDKNNSCKDMEYLGTWLYDVTAGNPTKLCDEGHEVHWASFDGNLYIIDNVREEGVFNTVKRWDSAHKKVVDTPYKDFNFSPDGKYYYCRFYGGPKDPIYLRESNRDISSEYSFWQEMQHFQFDKWMNNTILSIRNGCYKGKGNCGLFDCANGAFYGVPGYPVALVDNGAALIVSTKEDTLVTMKLTDLPILFTGITSSEKSMGSPVSAPPMP